MQKGVYPYEYGMIWKNLVKFHFLKKDDFYSRFAYTEKGCKDFKIGNLRVYHESDTILLAEVSENFLNIRNIWLDLYEFDPALDFISAPGLAYQSALKKNKIKLDPLIDIDMLLMVEKRIRDGTVTLFMNI